MCQPMMTGRVKWFNVENGYGFILIEDDVEVFVHFSQINGDGYRMLHPGELVEFELEKSKKGLQALNVKRLGLPPSGNGTVEHGPGQSVETSKSTAKSG